MTLTGQLLNILRAVDAVAAQSDHGAGYTEIAKATGMTYYSLAAKTCRLKARGLIERANPGAPRSDHAFFVVTAAGRAALNPEPVESEVPVSSVQRAIQRRHALATCWAVA